MPAMKIGIPVVPRMSEPRWYVVEAERGEQAFAALNLINQGYEAYLPTILVRMQETIKGKRQSAFTWVSRPMFFNFIFVKFDIGLGMWPRKDTRLGIKGVLSFAGSKPSPVERGFVETLIEMKPVVPTVDAGAFPPLAKGCMVVVKDGLLAGKTVQVEQCNGFTTTVWGDAFGGKVKILIHRQDIAGA
jgi:transcription antitermination factor NusG